MGDGVHGVHGAIVQLPVVAQCRIEQGVAIHLGQLKVVHLVLASLLNTRTAMLYPAVCNILAKLDTRISAI